MNYFIHSHLKWNALSVIVTFMSVLKKKGKSLSLSKGMFLACSLCLFFSSGGFIKIKVRVLFEFFLSS